MDDGRKPEEPPLLRTKPNKGLTRALRAALHSANGIYFAVREESSFRQELALAALLVPIAFFLPVSPIERLLLIGSVILILIVELLNSAVEAAIDRISFELHDLSKRAKDFGSAAVMLALLLCVATWATVVWPLALVWFHS
jgi:diacylglycerol kinase (ATP)